MRVVTSLACCGCGNRRAQSHTRSPYSDAADEARDAPSLTAGAQDSGRWRIHEKCFGAKLRGRSG